MPSGNTVEDSQSLESDFEKGEENTLDMVNDYIHRGNDPNLKDEESGNGWLHYAAKYNFKHVAAKLLDHEIDTLARNKEGKTALEVAIYKKFDQMSALIARRMTPSDLFTGVCSNVGSAVESDGSSVVSAMDSNEEDSSEKDTKKVNKKIKLKDLIRNKECDFRETLLAVFDSLQIKHVVEDDDIVYYNVKILEEDENGRTPEDPDFNERDHTVLHTLAEKEHKEVISHPAIRLLVAYKWNKWAKYRFMRNSCVYFFSLISLTFSAAVGATTADVKTYNNGLQYARGFFEVVSYGTFIKSFIFEMSQLMRHRLSYFKIRYNLLELVSTLLLISVLPLRYINTQVHWYFFAFGYMVWVGKIFKYAVFFSKTGAYVESLRIILWKDLLPFGVLFCIVNIAFGGTFLLVLKGDDSLETHNETSSLYGIWYVGIRTLIEAQPVVEYAGEEGYRPIGTFVMLLFMLITTVVLLNILIAQISETYQNVQADAWKSVVVNRASIITRLERNRSHYPFCRNLFNRKRAYKEQLKGKNLKKMVEKNAQPMELIKSELTEIQNKLVKNDLKVQTVKTRLHNLNCVLADTQMTLQSLKEDFETRMSCESRL